MSGGSFDYAYMAMDLEEFIEKIQRWRELRDDFEAEGFDDVAAEIDATIRYVEVVERRVAVRLRRLTDVAKAMEWWRSCDSGRDSVERAAEAWRGQA